MNSSLRMIDSDCNHFIIDTISCTIALLKEFLLVGKFLIRATKMGKRFDPIDILVESRQYTFSISQ